MLNHQRVPILMWSDSGARLLIGTLLVPADRWWLLGPRWSEWGAPLPRLRGNDHGIGNHWKSLGNHWDCGEQDFQVGTCGLRYGQLEGIARSRRDQKRHAFFQLKRRLSHWSRGFLSVVINLHLSSSQPLHRNLEPTQCETWRNKTNQGDCCPHMSQGSALRVVEPFVKVTNHEPRFCEGHFASPSEFLPSLYHGSPVHTRWGTLLS